LASFKLKPIIPWWCDCKRGLGYKDEHPPECYGNQPSFPKLTAALRDRERDR
jgi:hypothetical protein